MQNLINVLKYCNLAPCKVKAVKHVTPIIEPLNKFWDTYHDDEYFIWVINASNQTQLRAEINWFNLN
jgi:hypothetical protein